MQRLLILTLIFFGLGIVSGCSSNSNLPAFVAGLAAPAPNPGATIIWVDRADDPEEEMACSSTVDYDCPLRSAIQKANGQLKLVMIQFADHYIIRLSRPLPAISGSQTNIVAELGQEVHVDGQAYGTVLGIIGNNITVSGLRVYGAGAGYPTISISQAAHAVTIANNVIGDNDAPDGNCVGNSQSHSGIYIDTQNPLPEGLVAYAWIYGNIIECNAGSGIQVVNGNAWIGLNQNGESGGKLLNRIRHNQGDGIDLGDNAGSKLYRNLVYSNVGDGLNSNNPNNDHMENVFR